MLPRADPERRPDAGPRSPSAPSSPALAGTLAAILALGGCFLPPPAEDKPLTAAVDRPARVDSSLGGDGAREPDPRPALAGSRGASASETAGRDAAGAGAAATAPSRDDTASLVADASPHAPLDAVEPEASVEGPPEGSATRERAADVAAVPAPTAVVDAASAAPGGVDLRALERDEAAEPAPAAASDLVPSDVEETVDRGEPAPTEPEPDGADGPERAERPERAEEGDPVGVLTRAVPTADGLTMSYRVRGPLVAPGDGRAGPTVVFIHGWCGRGDQWDAAMAALPTARCVAVDLVGHGASRDQARADWTVPRFGADVTRALEAEGLAGVILVGHGMGGQVALEVAVRAPERVRAIVGVDCLQRLAGDPNPGRLQQYVETFRRDYEQQMRQFVTAAVGADAPDEVVDRILGDSLDPPREMALALMEHFGVHDPRRAAPRIECRVVCVNSPGLATDVEGNRALLSSFDVEVVEDVGHWIHLERPERFAQVLRAWIAQLEPTQAPERVLQSLAPVLVAADAGAVAAFYVDELSFSIVRRVPQDPARPPVMVSLERDGARVVIQSLESMRAELPGAALEARAGALFLRVESLAAEVAELGDHVEFVVRERELASGSRQAVLADPEGNLVVLQESGQPFAGAR